MINTVLFKISTHILTKRMTFSSYIFHHHSPYFNSHPHEEDDISDFLYYRSKSISTHILTKRMTNWRSEIRKNSIKISTHILTKRMTRGATGATGPQGISTHILTKRMTTSAMTVRTIADISTHILTKRMTHQRCI